VKLYEKYTIERFKGEFIFPETAYSEATLSDIQAYLSERGLVAVPLEPSEKMQHEGVVSWNNLDGCCGVSDVYKAMITAHGEE